MSPFVVARGRQPLLPGDQALLDDAYQGALEKPLEEHSQQLKENLELARKLVLELLRNVREYSSVLQIVPDLSIRKKGNAWWGHVAADGSGAAAAPSG